MQSDRHDHVWFLSLIYIVFADMSTLLPSRRKFCVHYTTMHHVTSCKATYVRCTFGRMTWIFYVLLRQHGDGTDTEIRVSTEG